MTSKKYGWQKLWTVDRATNTAKHETGLTVKDGQRGARVVIGAEQVIADLTPKHGHNASDMVRRLVKEAGILLNA